MHGCSAHRSKNNEPLVTKSTVLNFWNHVAAAPIVPEKQHIGDKICGVHFLETHGHKPIVPEKTLVIKCTVPIFGETHGCSARLSRTKPLDAKSTASICWKHVAAGPTVPDKTNRR
jgi:hypothetical protein